MSTRYFNWKLAIILIISLGVIGLTFAGIYAFRLSQKERNSKQGLILGNKAYEEQKWEDAAKQLGIYLLRNQDDVEILIKYAKAQMNTRPRNRNNIQRAISAYRTALRIDENQLEAAQHLIEIYLMVGLPGEAELIAERQLEIHKDPKIRRMLAIALSQQRNFGEAAAELKAICAEHPDQILAYESLGQLTEQHPEEFTEQASVWFDEAVKNNPSSALAYLVRAAFYMRNNDRSKALEDINKAEQQDLSDTSVRMRLAMELINVNLLDRAEQQLAAIEKLTPADQNLWQLWAQLALRSQSGEKMSNIAQMGLKELSSQPWDFMPVATELFIRSGRTERAAECIAQLRQKDIPVGVINNLEALLAANKGNYTEAIKYWKQSVESGNKSAQIRLALSAALALIGDRQSALNQLYSLVAENPNSFEGHLSLARMLAQSADWADVEEHAEKAMRLAPSNPEPVILFLQARMQLAARNPAAIKNQILQEIERQLSTLDKSAPGNLELGLMQLQLKIEQGKLDEAAEIINRLKQEHASETVTITLAEVELLAAQDKTTEGISKLNETIEKFPQDSKLVRYLAILLFREGQDAECEAVLKDALARIEQPAVQRELGLMLAQFYLRWNRTNDAYQYLAALSQKLPDDIPIIRQLMLCEQVFNDQKKTQQLIDKIKSLEGEDGWQWRFEQAKVLFTAENFDNNYPKIISLLQENLLANPNDQASRMLLARAYDKAGELQLAISTYRDALNRSPDDLRIITPTIAALYKAKEYEQAEELLNLASRDKNMDIRLQKLQLQNFLRRGQLDSASDILQDLVESDPNNQNASFSLALLKMQQGEFEESEEILAKLKAQDPNSIAVIATQIQLYLRQNKQEQALEICNEMVNHLNNASAYILSARTYATLGRYDKALEDINRAVSLEPENMEVWIARSDFFRSVGQIDKAADDIKHALSLSPDDLKILKRVVSLFFASRQPDMVREGKNFLDRALELYPGDTELKMFKANSLLIEGTAPAIESAKQILQKLTEEEPEISEAWLLLGELLLKQGLPGQAVDISMSGLAYKPNDKKLMLLKARAEAVKSPVLAVPTLKELRELDPNDLDVLTLLTNTYIDIGEPQKAVDMLRKHLTTCDISALYQCRLTLAVALYKAGDKEEAQKQFDSLVESEPNNPLPLITQTQLLKKEKLWNQLNQKVVEWYQKYPNDTRTPVFIAGNLISVDSNEARQAAEEILRLILQKETSSTGAMNTLALLLEMTGRSDESAELYRRVIELEPGNIIALNNLAWITSEKKGQYQEALELAQKGLALSPDYLDLIETRGVVYYRLGELNNAVQDLTKCVEFYPNSTPQYVAANFHLARVLNALGKNNDAIKYLNEALSLEGKIGGLSNEELTEAKRLFIKLQEGK
ncbi:MAG: tetratricopeptide repeat protein [Sedimentisphaerales bacterium]|nr:tetratricopeptide repeat protein [Sedimentisphaerales bacterium]